MRSTLFFAPQMEPLARGVASAVSGIDLGEISWDSFPDGSPNTFVHRQDEMRGRDVTFLASFDTMEDIQRQLGVIYALPKCGVHSFRLVLPYFSMGTMDRVNQEGEVANAMTLARQLSVIPHARSTTTEIIIYDIHALQERFYFSDNVIPRLETAIPLLKTELRGLQHVAIAFPDDGAWKRFHHLFPEYPHIVCLKVRDGDKRIIKVKEGNALKKYVVIVDDLALSGGTIIECADVLRSHGASAVAAYVTHGVFPQNAWKRFLDARLEHVWMTDSCPYTVRAVQGINPFMVLSLASPIAHVVMGR